jgi:hypothetical protein
MTDDRSQLRSDEFWGAAFDESAPFVESYRSAFREGIQRRNVASLDLHREAIYYLNGNAVWPIVAELLAIVAAHPGADVVESLDNFLLLPEKQRIIFEGLRHANYETLSEIASALSEVKRALAEHGDNHLIDGYDWLAGAVADHLDSGRPST